MNALCEGSIVVLDGGEGNGSRLILDAGIACGNEGPRATERRVLVDGLGKGGGGMVTICDVGGDGLRAQGGLSVGGADSEIWLEALGARDREVLTERFEPLGGDGGESQGIVELRAVRRGELAEVKDVVRRFPCFA